MEPGRAVHIEVLSYEVLSYYVRQGRVFYSTLGHTPESWDDPDVQKMYFEAIRWALGMTEGSTTPHPKPAQ